MSGNMNHGRSLPFLYVLCFLAIFGAITGRSIQIGETAAATHQHAVFSTAAVSPTLSPTMIPNPTPTEEPTIDYVLNTNTHKFHYTHCKSVDKMKETNKCFFSGTREEVVRMGYEPCGNCKP